MQQRPKNASGACQGAAAKVEKNTFRDLPTTASARRAQALVARLYPDRRGDRFDVVFKPHTFVNIANAAKLTAEEGPNGPRFRTWHGSWRLRRPWMAPEMPQASCRKARR